MKKILFSTFLCTLTMTISVLAQPIYEYKKDTVLYNGVTHTSYQQFYSDKNIKFDVITADLNKDYLKLELLKSEKGIDILDTVENLTKTHPNTIAATNADFFSVHKGNQGFSLGLEVKNNKLLQSPIDTEKMAGGFVTNNKLDLSYLTFHRMLVAPNGQYQEIRHTNKHTTYYGDILMYTKDFNNGMSPAPGGEVVEMVVADNQVIEFRRNMPSVEIPSNGFVLVASEGTTMFLDNNFDVGDTVKIDLYATPDITSVDTAFGGGTLLLKDGKYTAITHNVNGYNPRTAIGTDVTGKIIYFVTVDGRQTLSKGVTLTELAEIMKNLGCYNAINLDGGGSTRLVGKELFNSNIHTLNSPTENRKVINSLAITSSAYPSEPSSVLLNLSKNVVFIDDSVEFEARIFDKYLNPVWNGEKPTITPSNGFIIDNKLYPQSGGTSTLTATYGNASDTKNITVIDEISSIKLYGPIYLMKEQTANLEISVADEFGNNCDVTNYSSFNITSLNPEIASYTNQKIKGHKTGMTYLKVERKGVVSYLKVIVGNPSTIPYSENFEVLNATFAKYPEDAVKGSYSISSEQKTSGTSSGKLTFDFTDTSKDVTKAAYIVFDPIELTDNTDNISFDLYSDIAYDKLQIKFQFNTGSDGKILRLTALEGVKPGWQRVTLNIPEDTDYPLSLTRIYAVQIDSYDCYSGSLYFDNLQVNCDSSIISINNHLNTVNDPSYGINENNTTLTFAGIPDSITSLMDKVTYQKLSSTLSDKGFYALIGKCNFNSKVNNNTIDTSTYNCINNTDYSVINLITEEGSIKKYDNSQWDKLNKDITSINNKNIFILINGDLDISSYEGKVLLDYLNNQNKNIFIVTNSNQTTMHTYNNVKLFELSDTGDGINIDDKLVSINLLKFNISHGHVTYEFQKLFKDV